MKRCNFRCLHDRNWPRTYAGTREGEWFKSLAAWLQDHKIYIYGASPSGLTPQAWITIRKSRRCISRQPALSGYHIRRSATCSDDVSIEFVAVPGKVPIPGYDVRISYCVLNQTRLHRHVSKASRSTAENMKRYLKLSFLA
jgi:hypothetical protein